MEDVVECSISVSGWCPWCKQPRVDGCYPGEITLMFAPFFSRSLWLSLLIVFTLPSLMFSIPDNSRTAICLFYWISASTRSLFSPIVEVLSRRSWVSFTAVSLPFLKALLHLQTLTFDSVFSPYCLFNLEQISDSLQPSFVRNLIIMGCSTLTCIFASLIFLTTDICTVANTRSVNDLLTVLPPSTYYYFQWTVLHFWTMNKL